MFTNEFRVRCTHCKHQWVAFYAPMLLEKVAKLLAGLHCPHCAADANQIRHGWVEESREPAPVPTADEAHAAAIAELTAILCRDHDPAPESEAGQRVQALAVIIEAYEKVRWPI